MDQSNQVVERGTRRCVVSSTSSDSHTWNLIFLQLLLEETGFEVSNLGSCVPDQLLVDECRLDPPDLLVLSSVNGHGFHDGLRAINRLRQEPDLADLPVVIGGRLGIDGADKGAARTLLSAGFDAVYQDSADDVRQLRSFVSALPGGADA